MVEHPDPEAVMAWVDGEAGSAAPEIERHVRDCADCRAIAADLRGVSHQLGAWTVSEATFNMPVPRSGWASPWRWVAMAAMLLLSVFTWSWFGAAPPAQNAPLVLIEVFVDWQCPVCMHLEYQPVIDAMQADKPGSIQFVLRDYPLNHRCNMAVSGEPHAAACEAAAAVRMARERGKSDEFISWVMTNQAGMTPDTVKTQARRMLGVTDFDAEYARKVEEISRDVSAGVGRNVRFTPAVFMNGRSVNTPEGRAPSPVEFERMIRELLAAGGLRGRRPR